MGFVRRIFNMCPSYQERIDVHMPTRRQSWHVGLQVSPNVGTK